MCPQELDANGDGSISQIEFIKGLRKNPILAQKLEMPSVIHQESESRTLFQQAFHEIDVDESKTISQDEFLAFYRPLSALPSGSGKAYDWRPEDNPHPAQQMHTEPEPFLREDTYEQPPSQAVPQAGVPHATSQTEPARTATGTTSPMTATSLTEPLRTATATPSPTTPAWRRLPPPTSLTHPLAQPRRLALVVRPHWQIAVYRLASPPLLSPSSPRPALISPPGFAASYAPALPSRRGVAYYLRYLYRPQVIS